MSIHGTCLSAFLINKFHQLIGIIISYQKKKEKRLFWIYRPFIKRLVLALYGCLKWKGWLHQTTLLKFAKILNLVTLLLCTLYCPTFCNLVYISPTPLCSCVQVRCAQGRELALCTARLGCQVSTGWIKWTKGFVHLLWAAKHCLVQDTLIFPGLEDSLGLL